MNIHSIDSVSQRPTVPTGHLPAANMVQPLVNGTVNNLAAGVGTALAEAWVVSILGLNMQRRLVDNSTIPPDLIQQVNLDNVTFVSNNRLETAMANTTATPEQVAEAVRINADARLRALKLSFLFLSVISLLMIVPSRRLPRYVPGEVPSEPIEAEAAEI